MKFHLAQAAIEDLESIDDYTVNTWGGDQAGRYLGMIWAVGVCVLNFTLNAESV